MNEVIRKIDKHTKQRTCRKKYANQDAYCNHNITRFECYCLDAHWPVDDDKPFKKTFD